MPRYEYSEGTSNKFWEIELSGTSYTSKWGKIGGSTSMSTKSYGDAAAAKKELDKLVAEKLKKGYTLVGGAAKKQAGKPAKPVKPVKPAGPARNAELEKAIRANPEDPDAYLVYADWMQANGEIRGELAVLQHAGKTKEAKAMLRKYADWFLGDFAKKAKALPSDLELEWYCGFIKKATIGWPSFEHGMDYDDETAGEQLDEDESWYERCQRLVGEFLKLPSAQFIQELELGPMPGDEECSLGCFARAIDEVKPVTLRKLTIANTGEWDISSTSTAMPDSKSIKNLRELRIGGGTPSIGKIDLPELRSFSVETGGLGKKALAEIAAAKWPKLERLEIWTGDPSYGSTCTAKQLAPIFAATGLKHLKHLMLKNCAFADAAVKLLVNSKLLRQLETLDLSMGNLSDKGVAMMLKDRAQFAHLTLLCLDDSALDETTDKMVKGLAKKVTMLGQTPERAVPRGENSWGRYTAVGE
ncbi:MAG: WGR domain-containing protein [Kofleriaceae bacterium]